MIGSTTRSAAVCATRSPTLGAVLRVDAVVDRHPLEARCTLVGAHLLPRRQQHVAPIDPVTVPRTGTSALASPSGTAAASRARRSPAAPAARPIPGRRPASGPALP